MDFVFLGASALMAAALFGLISFCDRLGRASKAGVATVSTLPSGSVKAPEPQLLGGRK